MYEMPNPQELDRIIAEARRQRSEALAQYAKQGFALLRSGLARLLTPFREWQARAALAAELRGMSEMQLRDIGISRADIDAVVDGSYRDERPRLRRRPILVRIDPGQRRLPTGPTGTPKAA